MSRLKGKAALVTGASKGIGAGIAKAFAAEGAAVAVNYASSRAGADRVVSEIEARGGRAVAVQGDVGKAADARRIVDETVAAFGRLDVLVNNAGVYRFAPLEEITEAEFRRHFDTNVLGLLLVTQEAVKRLGPQGGSIINISSLASTNAMPATAVYSATKGAVDSITLVLASELGPRKIRVNAINPGGVDTEGVEELGFLKTELAAQMIAQTPLGRVGRPEDIAAVAVFLASEDSGWITGQMLVASGGLR
jgi:3-oxoacyl-[acyl-carrier protein] reductase